ncbi:MAG TPA: bifunctional demethylmenaquinone methyltransferase/2-methoxy-6-polyprenyl-1,4-benzoquinol methylase UbiE [Bacteroidales bacterium]|nr:bifunctional demethylmenaquinone methyltransferase/2-methoxy-6-polyprenyl-1,4-benzoquinol methylase UbiE [Bacteroidales bacterium]HRZ48742.1 bifunctional demethylmenaquinone methyltransferase/2-methoxy-6-polyprenyl-1,4-benzoquinol methylase UbiE [Bacteroidales bacterium]
MLDSQGKKATVRQMFNDISERYDLLNHLLSFGIDQRWRKKLVKRLALLHPGEVLDVATGTGDLALAVAKVTKARITGTDIAEKMLEIASRKISDRGMAERIRFVHADGESLPFEDHSFDAVTIAFGIRNFENPLAGLHEFYRVLKPGGQVFILEFSMPESRLIRWLYTLYFGRILPKIGRWISKHPQAYTYLPDSVEAFPYGDRFCRMMQEASFQVTESKSLSGGIAMLYTGVKA